MVKSGPSLAVDFGVQIFGCLAARMYQDSAVGKERSAGTSVRQDAGMRVVNISDTK